MCRVLNTYTSLHTIHYTHSLFYLVNISWRHLKKLSVCLFLLYRTVPNTSYICTRTLDLLEGRWRLLMMMCPVCGATVFRIVWRVSRLLTERKPPPYIPLSSLCHFLSSVNPAFRFYLPYLPYLTQTTVLSNSVVRLL